jgi:hypothetical protein
MHISICKSVYYSIKLYNVPLRPRATRLRCDLIFSSSPPSYKTNKYSTEKARVSTEKLQFVRRSCMFLRRRGAPFGPPYRVSHKCYAFQRRSCGVSTEKMRVSTEKLHICTEKRLSVTEQRWYSTEKFDFHGITTRLYGEGARFYAGGLALMGHRSLVQRNCIESWTDFHTWNVPFKVVCKAFEHFRLEVTYFPVFGL